jgi:hypothetical protein
MDNKTSPVCKVRVNKKKGPTHPGVRNTTRLHQYDPLQKLDSGKLHASLRIR